MNAEYVRDMGGNFIRICSERKANGGSYPYRILSKGLVKGILPCQIQRLDGEEYLYFDITSVQSVSRLYENQRIGKKWMKYFLEAMRDLRMQMQKFLLTACSVIWNPEHIFQDPEKEEFHFLYMPGKKDTDFGELLDFWVEKLDYEKESEDFVEFVYNAHEKYREYGASYLEKGIWEDFCRVGESTKTESENPEVVSCEPEETITNAGRIPSKGAEELEGTAKKEHVSILFRGWRKQKQEEIDYRESLKRQVLEYHVAEPQTMSYSGYESGGNIGRTTFLQESEKKTGLYRKNGELACSLETLPIRIGKRKDESEWVLKDFSVSRIHARISKENGRFFLEDLNSTNGTFKNGLRLKPYERMCITQEDEIRIGRLEFILQGEEVTEG